MGFMKGFKNLFIGEDETDQLEYEAEYRAARQAQAARNQNSDSGFGSYGGEDSSYSYSRPAQTRAERPAPSSDLGFDTSSYKNENRGSERQMSADNMQTLQIVLARPVDFSEVREIGDDINAFKTVILNLEMVKSDDAKRILDFLSGVAYANKAQIKMMAQKTFAIMSKNVKFDGKDLMTELENNGYSF
ncbi:MAG: cell division protein SepF [Ruminococcus sp.]|nr:cell division protein SepF [Ruminococcus sp.]